VQEETTGRTNSTTTLMKKLFSLAMVAALVLAVVGCEKKVEDTTVPSTGTVTNK
jgi:hypothetical protein